MRFFLSVVITVLIAGCSTNNEYDMNDIHKMYGDKNTEIATIIDKVSKQKIFFGHQSVGNNIIGGMTQWESESGHYIIKEETRNFTIASDNTFIHCKIGENLDPQSKIDDFVSLMATIPEEQPSIAFFKLCYVDIYSSSDVDAIFSHYAEKIHYLKDLKPNCNIVLVTTPLTAVQKGLKATAKKILNKSPHGYLDNIKRNDFNNLLKDEFSGVLPIFDLAGVESTLPNGDVETFTSKGNKYPCVPVFYTSDMGHLNEYGARIVSYNLLAFLADEL